MKYIVSFVFILASLWSCTDDFDSVNLTITEVGKGDFTYTETDTAQEFLLVTNSIHWNQLKIKAQPGSITDTNVDFSLYTIIGCIESVKTSGGYAVSIESVVEEEDEIKVNVVSTSPGSGGATTVMTRPFHFVKVPKFSKAAVFTN